MRWLSTTGLAILLAAQVPCDAAEPITNFAAPSVLAPSDSQRAPLSLIVNGVSKGDVVGILRSNDVLLTEDDARSAGVPFPPTAIVDVSGARYVSLALLAPHATYRLDLTTVTLTVTVDPLLLGHTTVALDASGAEHSAIARSDPSGFLTYSLSSDTANMGGDANAFVQAGATSGLGIFTASSEYASGHARRGLVAYQLDSDQHLNRLVIGDELVSSDALGASTVIGGVGVSRHFEFQPNYAYFPSPGLSGTVLGPTTADIYVNGTLLRSVQLAPGVFNLNNIPVPIGAGVTQIVLHDALGNTQTLSGVFYQTRSLLSKGLTDYDYHLGFVRLNPFGDNDVYGPLTAIGSYRLGLTNSLTVGGRFERWAGSADGGPQIDVGLPIGHLSLESSLSDSFGTSGNALAVAYDYVGRRFGLNLSALTQSANYATPSLVPGSQRTRSSIRESLSLPLSRRATLQLSNTTTSFAAQPTAGQLLAMLDVQVPRQNAYVTLSAERDSGGSILGLNSPTSNGHWTLGTQLSFSLGKTFLSASTSSDAASGSNVQFSNGVSTGPGFGYQVSAETRAQLSAAAQINYNTQYGNIQALGNAGSGTPSTTLTLNGSLVGFKQGLFFSQPVTNAFALADVPGFRGLAVFSRGQYAGRTDGRDALVVPNLDPYNDNPIAIDQLPDRLDLIEDASTINVRPKDQSGVTVRFSVREFHAYTGHIIIVHGSKSIVPALGSLVLSRSGKQRSTDLGSNGQFYTEDLEPGLYAATIDSIDGSRCAFQINLPPGEPKLPVTSLGTIKCETTP
jgi:outer membrane usher protein